MHTPAPVRIALIDDYDLVLRGLADMLRPYADRVVVVELDANQPLTETVDIALLDSFARTDPDQSGIEVLAASPHARRVVVYTWNFHPDLVAGAREQGASGYLSKTLTARQLVDALVAVHAGETIISSPPPTGAHLTGGQDWPGRREGLTDREAEILALITQGLSNAQVAELTYLRPNTVKSYIRTLYRKIEVTSRTQAVIWGIHHGFSPDHRRLDTWRGTASQPRP